MGDLVGRFTGHFVGFAGVAPHVGLDEGAGVGSNVEGTGVGIADGAGVGMDEGAGVGMDEGAGVGSDVEGAGVGISDGAKVGMNVGYHSTRQQLRPSEVISSGGQASHSLWPL